MTGPPSSTTAAGGPLSSEGDVLVVGAGTACWVLASRLSEDSGRRVVLLMAGERITGPGADVPGAVLGLLVPPNVYVDQTPPQPALGGQCPCSAAAPPAVAARREPLPRA